MTGDVQTDERFWDCECEENYIHSKQVSIYCPLCDMYEADCPDSRVEEIGRGGLFATDEDLNVAYTIEEYYDTLCEYDRKVGID